MLLYNFGGNAEDEVAGTGGTGRPDNCSIEGTGRLRDESDIIEVDGSCDVSCIDCVDDCCCGIGGAGRLRKLEDGTEGTGRLGGTYLSLICGNSELFTFISMGSFMYGGGKPAPSKAVLYVGGGGLNTSPVSQLISSSFVVELPPILRKISAKPPNL